MINTHITNVTTAHNIGGMELLNMRNTHIINTTTSHNDGDGMYLHNMINTCISKTTAAHNGWAGMRLLNMSNTHIADMTATHNEIGMYLRASNITHMMKITATHNRNIHSYIGVFQGQIIIVSSTTTLIYNTSFTDVSAQSTSSTANPTSLPAVIVLHQSTLLVSDCDFTRNNISAIGAYASNITMSGDLMFFNNKALAGTAFILIQDSILTSAENSHVYFLNNHATSTGGVIYINSNDIHLHLFSTNEYYSRSTCFLNTEGSRSCIRFTFANNSAGKGGDILYGGQVAFGLDGE